MLKSKWIMVLGILASLVVGSVAFAANQAPNLSITIPRMEAVTIDGSLSDAGWLTTSTKGGKVVVDVANDASALSEYPRVMYIGYDDNNIYLGGVIYAPDATKLVGDGGNLWDNDEVEFFVDPNQVGSYKQLFFSSAGVASDASIIYAVKKDGIRWVFEAAIPFNVMSASAPKQGDKWGINIVGRQLAVGDLWVAWNTPYGRFANPARFAVATFGN